MDIPTINGLSAKFKVPTIDERKRISFEIIEQITEKIVEQFSPERIILFGTYAYGEPTPESDIDLLVIMDTDEKETQKAMQIRKLLNPLFGLDILVYTPENLRKRIAWGDSFLQEIIDRGRILI